jgi:hypothetical protein
MNKPWELKSEDARSSDSLYTFIIFCEDSSSEPAYFESFETSKIKVTAIKNQHSGLRNINNAVHKCASDGILEKNEHGYTCTVDGLEIWCVFDRDTNGIEGDKQDTEFNLAIHAAQQNNINTAWSNDCFELWVLLHFTDVSLNPGDFPNRQSYYDYLTNVYKNHQAPNELLQKSMEHDSFGYKKDLKRERMFKSVVLPEIKPQTQLAIERAKRLVDLHLGQHDHAKKSPCTQVHVLVERLLQEGS